MCERNESDVLFRWFILKLVRLIELCVRINGFLLRSGYNVISSFIKCYGSNVDSSGERCRFFIDNVRALEMKRTARSNIKLTSNLQSDTFRKFSLIKN